MIGSRPVYTGIAVMTIFPLWLLLFASVTASADKGSADTVLINATLYHSPIHIYRSGTDAFQQIFGINVLPSVVVKYNNYTIEVYYYHPGAHGTDMRSAVFDPISLITNVIAQKCYNATAPKKEYSTQLNISKMEIQHLREIEKNIKSKYRYMWYCPSQGIIFIGVKNDHLNRALTDAKMLAMEFLNRIHTHYHRIVIYGLEYGRDETPLSIGSSYYYRLDALLEENTT